MIASRVDRIEHSPVLVIGGGAAGLSVALACEGLPVRLLAKGQPGRDGASAMAQGGIAAALDGGDSPALHALDTRAAAGGIGSPVLADLVAAAAPAQIRRLRSLGARFDHDAAGAIALGREAAHSRSRIVHAGGDETGAELSRVLGRAARATSRIEIETDAVARELVRRNGRVVGVLAQRSDGSWVAFTASAVVLCTGGIGRVYADTTNPLAATGDGLAMAARAGARLADLEFVQFHPTVLGVDADPRPLLTEALRGAGALLVDGNGWRFMVDLDDRVELAPRDVVARAIAARLERGATVYLDARAAPGAEFPERFPGVFALCAEHGLDPRHDLLPVRPAAHYHMGGVATDPWGRTSLQGLWAAGEVACTGLHGANRLASNSLLECLVLGGRVGEDIARHGSLGPASLLDPRTLEVPARGERQGAVESQIRRLMSARVGVTRDSAGLDTAWAELARLQHRAEASDPGTRNLWTVARLVTAAARQRAESRGSHYRLDFPGPDRCAPYRLFVVQTGRGSELAFERIPTGGELQEARR